MELFADTEFCEDHPEQVVRGRRASDFSQGLMRQAQLLSKHLASALFRQGCFARQKVSSSPAQRIDMPTARGHGLLAQVLVTCQPANLSAER